MDSERIASFHPLSGMRVLNDHGIHDALSRGLVKVDKELEEEQFQPNTLDVRIGKVKIYDYNNREPIEGVIDPDDILPTNIISDKKDAEIILPGNSFAEIYLHEIIDFDKNDYMLGVDLRSSRGRNGLSLVNQHIEKDKEGNVFLPVRNLNPNPVKLYGHERFAQLFFYVVNNELPADGHVVGDVNEARGLCDALSDDVIKLEHNYILLNVGSRLLRYKTGVGMIDTRKQYEEEELFNVRGEGTFTLSPGDVYILELEPELHVPDDMGISLLHQMPYKQRSGLLVPDPTLFFLESHRLNAGWVDSGYSGKVTAHPQRINTMGAYETGHPIVLGMIYKYDNAARRSYGDSELGSKRVEKNHMH